MNGQEPVLENNSRTPRAYTKDTYMIPMRDGIRLATDVYLPSPINSPHGAILIRTPYNKNWLSLTGASSANNGWPTIIQDVRGRFNSEGVDTVFMNAHTDGPDTLEWIAAQNWSNGKIATYGGSALGKTQYYMAGSNPLNLSCQFIMVATPDMHKHAMYQGGQFRKNMIEKWLQGQGSTHVLPEILQNENYTLQYWTNVSLEDNWQDINVPAIHLGGWYDCFDQGIIDGFMGYQYSGGFGAKGKSKLVMGPWTHGGKNTETQGELTYPDNSKDNFTTDLFWDMVEQYTMGIPGTFDSWHNVSYYVMGDVNDTNAPGNEWRYSDVWPLSTINETPFYFYSNNLLDPRIPIFNESLSYDYDPTDPIPTVGGQNLNLPRGPYDQTSIEARDDVLLYTSPVLTQPIEATGPVKARLYVSSNCVDTDFTVKLTDVYPDGRSMLITDGILRMRNRNGRDHWELMNPGEVYEVEVDLWSTSYVWNTGHRIRVAVSSSNYPRFLANPNTADGIYQNSTYNIANNTVHMTNEYPSCILLPIIGEVPNEKPVVVKNYPLEVEMYENETYNFSVMVSDEEIKSLSYTWSMDGNSISGWDEPYYNYYTDFDSAGEHILNITVTDTGTPALAGYAEYLITVHNVNRLPIIIYYSPDLKYSVNEVENGVLNFSIEAKDLDGDELLYKWYMDNVEMPSETKVFSLFYNYTSAGDYIIEVKINDTIDNISMIWHLNIGPTNRAPKIVFYTPEKNYWVNETNEGIINFLITAFDPDGDNLSYTWFLNSTLINNEFNTKYSLYYNYTSAGEYELKVIVNDSKAEASHSWNLKIINVNRPPIITYYDPKQYLELFETMNGTQNFTIKAIDLDHDKLTYLWYIDNKIISNGEDTIFGFNYDHTSSGEYEIMVAVNDSITEAVLSWVLVIMDVNRNPVVVSYVPVDDPTINEKDQFEFSITAHDPDIYDTLSYRWFLNGKLLVGLYNQTYTFNPQETDLHIFIISVEVYDGKGGNATKTWMLTVTDFDDYEKDDDHEKDQNIEDNFLIIIIIVIIIIFLLLFLIFLRQRKMQKQKEELECGQIQDQPPIAEPIDMQDSITEESPVATLVTSSTENHKDSYDEDISE
jgi:predicted acyl esterase